MSCSVYLHCLRVFHIYTVIVYSVVPENPKGQGQLEWFKVSHFIQRMKQRESKANQEFFESKNFVYTSVFDEVNRLIFVVQEYTVLFIYFPPHCVVRDMRILWSEFWPHSFVVTITVTVQWENKGCPVCLEFLLKSESHSARCLHG